MMCAVESFFFDYVVIELSHGARWFNCIDVQTRANAARFHRVEQRLLIDNFAASSVDEVSAGSHHAEEVSVDRISCLVVECEMNTHNVSFRGDGFRRLLERDTQFRRTQRR